MVIIRGMSESEMGNPQRSPLPLITAGNQAGCMSLKGEGSVQRLDVGGPFDLGFTRTLGLRYSLYIPERVGSILNCG